LGILTGIVTRIGIPIAIAVGAGLLIASFKDQIIGGISAGTSTIGQALSTPFGSFLSGLKAGFGNIPEFIDINFPVFRFNFAEGFDPAGDQPNEVATDIDQALINLCRNTGGLICLGGSGSTGAGGGSGQTSLTPFGDPDKRTFIDILQLEQGVKGSMFLDLLSRERTSKGELVDETKFVGLFDFLSTKGRTERVGLTFEQVQQFQGQIRLSSQLFEEFASVKDILAFG